MATDTTFTNQEFKIVGTRPPRPDGVDKVTGRARFGADASAAGQLVGLVLRSPHAHAKIKKIDTSKAEKLKGVKADRHQRRPAGPDEGRSRHVRHARELHGARPRAVRRTRGCGGRCNRRGNGPPGAEADQGRLRSAAARHRCRRSDEAQRADRATVHPHRRHRTETDEGIERRAEIRVRTRRRGGRLQAGRRHRGAQLQDGTDAPGLHRTARVSRERRSRRPGRAVGHHARPLHVPQRVCAAYWAWISRN